MFLTGRRRAESVVLKTVPVFQLPSGTYELACPFAPADSLRAGKIVRCSPYHLSPGTSLSSFLLQPFSEISILEGA